MPPKADRNRQRFYLVTELFHHVFVVANVLFARQVFKRFCPCFKSLCNFFRIVRATVEEGKRMDGIANTSQIFMIRRLDLPGLIVVLPGSKGLFFKFMSFGRCCRFRRLFFSGLRHDEVFFSR